MARGTRGLARVGVRARIQRTSTPASCSQSRPPALARGATVWRAASPQVRRHATSRVGVARHWRTRASRRTRRRTTRRRDDARAGDGDDARRSRRRPRATSTSSSRGVVERVVERDGPRRGRLLRVLGARERDVRGVDHERRRAIGLDRDRDRERGDLDVRVRQRWDLGRHRARNHARERRGVGGVVSEGRATSARGRGRTGLCDVCEP